MAEDAQQIRETTTRAGNTEQKTTKVNDPVAESARQQNVVARVVWFIAGVILALLGFRFLFSLLGANTTNAIADFVYSVSQPFVAPFFNLFSYNNYQHGVSRFEIYTLVAMAFYAFLAWGIARLVTISRD